MSNGNPMKEQGIGIFGSVVAIVAGWSLNDWLMVLGFLTTVITVATSQHYQRQREKREIDAARRKSEIDELTRKKLELELHLREARAAGLERRSDLPDIRASPAE
ncbi:MAG: phage holin family protein [Azoarcus sp.]|jgi:hypothetical protein|nr:phage holin family protein [Azoarcus sp.]